MENVDSQNITLAPSVAGQLQWNLPSCVVYQFDYWTLLTGVPSRNLSITSLPVSPRVSPMRHVPHSSQESLVKNVEANVALDVIEDPTEEVHVT